MISEEKNIETFATRLLQALEKRKIDLPILSKKTGISYEQLRRYSKDLAEPRPESLFKLSEVLSVDPAWLRYGGEFDTSRVVQNNVYNTGAIEVYEDKTPIPSDEIEIPYYKDVQLAAGNGFLDEIEDFNPVKLRFSKQVLTRYGVAEGRGVCVSVSGDSMQPMLPDGATVGINLDATSIQDGKIYAVNHGGLLRIKQLYRMPNNQVRLHSINSSEFVDEIADLATDNFIVLGKIFWWSVFV